MGDASPTINTGAVETNNGKPGSLAIGVGLGAGDGGSEPTTITAASFAHNADMLLRIVGQTKDRGRVSARHGATFRAAQHDVLMSARSHLMIEARRGMRGKTMETSKEFQARCHAQRRTCYTG